MESLYLFRNVQILGGGAKINRVDLVWRYRLLYRDPNRESTGILVALSDAGLPIQSVWADDGELLISFNEP